MSSIPNDYNMADVKTENTILFHAIQLHINSGELKDLNKLLLEFVDICSLYRPNPRLKIAIGSIISELHESRT